MTSSMINDPSFLLFLVSVLFVAIIANVILTIVLSRRVSSKKEFAALQDSLFRQSLEQRQEIYQQQQQWSENLVAILSNIAQAQSEQVNTVLQQSHSNMQAFDQRQQGIQQVVDAHLLRLEHRMQSNEQTVQTLLQSNDARIETMRQSVDGHLQRLRTDNQTKLEEMRQTVDEKLHATLEKRLGDSFSQVSTRLEQVYRSLGEVHSLASGVGDLKRMLSNVKTRGVWGEMQLGALLEQALTSAQYDRNVAVIPGSSERVEFAIRLPGKDNDRPLFLPIDSKFPQEDYVRITTALDEGDADALALARKSFLQAIKTEARRIGKYIAPPHTTDFAVMFLPLEGLYAEVIRNSDVIADLQQQQRILIAGPSTLLALLNSLQMGFRTLAIEQRSSEVWTLLGAVKTDFGNFAKVLQKTQEKLQQATATIDTAFVRTRSIERRLRQVEAIDETQASNLLSSAEEE